MMEKPGFIWKIGPENRRKTGKSKQKCVDRLCGSTSIHTFLLGFSCFLAIFWSDFPYKTRVFHHIFMGSTPIFEVRPDPRESFGGGSGLLICFLIGRLRPGVLFYFRSVFDFKMMALAS